MKKIVFIILLLLMSELSVNAQIMSADVLSDTEIKKEKFPAGADVEPRVKLSRDEEPKAIKAGIENTIYVNLEDCMKLALGNNPKIQSAMQDVFASDARMKKVWSAYFPKFSWQSGYSRIRQLQLSDVFRENLIYNYWVLGQISGSQMLYDFGVTQNKATIRKLDNLSYRIILTGTVNDVIYSVKDAYYYLQYALEALKVAEDTLFQYELFYEQAKLFYSVGVKPKVDVTISEVNLSNAKLNLIQAEHAVEIAMAKLNNAIGIPYFMRYSIDDRLKYENCDINFEKAVKIAEKSRPEFQLAEVKVEQAKQNVKLVKKSWHPEFYIQGQFEVGGRHPDSNYGYTFGGYINFPTINGMLIKHEIREARSLYSKEQANAINTKNNIYLEIQQAFYNLNEKKSQIPVAYLGMKQAAENYKLSNGRYKVGIGDPVEFNDAQVQLKNAQLTYYRTLYEYNSSRASLENSIGHNLCQEEVELNTGKHKNAYLKK